MIKIHLNLGFYILFSFTIYAQEQVNDSTKIVRLEEVIIISHDKLNNQKQVKPLSTIDDYLEKSTKITMIKRGNYGWEPAMNNMVSDRLSITIDGMQIFGACTDKMDPITSYIDVSNLSEVHVKSGQQGSENGSTIGGGIDLKLKRGSFDKDRSNFVLDVGYESNGSVKIVSSEFSFSNNKFFINSDVISRNSKNYKAGGGIEILYSQFKKYNISTIAGIKLNENNIIVTSLIYDEATDIGYPALPMDVSLAKALITSIVYEQKINNSLINKWESKLYYNSITHIMDDTKRLNVPIHMDMPGWSDTFGFYSKMKGQYSNHKLLFNANTYYNKSLAEMTMYPNNSNEKTMFMLTWPDIRTLHSGIYIEDKILLKNNHKVNVSARIGYQKEQVASKFGLNSLRIFYPNLEEFNSRFLINVSSEYEKKLNNFNIRLGFGYGERAPSVSESYGFYLYNSFDSYDYMGNPYLKNEKSIEFNSNLNYSLNKIKIGVEASYFYILNYIIGTIDPKLEPMTIGSNGVKVYTALNYATIFNTSTSISYQFSHSITINGALGYSLGKDSDNTNLPLISPLNYRMALHYKKSLFDAVISMKGAGKQINYSSYYGEDLTNSYTAFNANISYGFYFGANKLFVKTGIENIFDTYYSTYADWNNIPRIGRNVFLNLSFALN